MNRATTIQRVFRQVFTALKLWSVPQKFLAGAVLVLMVSGCVSVSDPNNRTGEYFLFTKRQFRLVNEAWHANDSHMNPLAIIAPFAIVGGSAVGLTIAPVVDVLCIPYDTYKKTESTVIAVVDEKGKPAAGVNVSILLTGPFNRIRGTTDKDGELHPYCDLRILKMCEIRLEGGGYYPSFWRNTCPEIDEGNCLKLRLTRISNPVPMALGELNLPLRNQNVSLRCDFDCECADWLPPYGEGRHGDIRVESLFFPEGTYRESAYTNVVSLTALDSGSGFARRPYNVQSEFGSDKCVPEGLEFTTNRIEVSYGVFDKDGFYKGEFSKRLDDHEYYIMRLRCETNESGEIVRARYGKMIFRRDWGLGSVGLAYLNVKANELSLEAQTGPNPAFIRFGIDCCPCNINWP